MKKKIAYFAGALCLAFSFILPVSADELHGENDWSVEFSASKEMVSNFSSNQFDDILDGMQPGDSAQFQVNVVNNFSSETDWYMTNEVLKSLEDDSLTAKGGAYSYVLTYTNPAGVVETLYNSEEVGGENHLKDRVGLHEATNALEEFFYLDTLKTGESGKVSLYVLLDGETQGNDYQDTLGQLQMNFAVELPTVSEGHTEQEKIVYRYHDNHIVKTEEDKIMYSGISMVKTGDETKFIGLFILAGVFGAILLVMSIVGFKLRKQMKEGQE